MGLDFKIRTTTDLEEDRGESLIILKPMQMWKKNGDGVRIHVKNINFTERVREVTIYIQHKPKELTSVRILEKLMPLNFFLWVNLHLLEETDCCSNRHED